MQIAELHQIFSESTGIATDTRTLTPGQLFFALKGPTYNADEFAISALDKGASYAVASLDCSTDHPKIIKVPDTLKTLQQLANYHRLQFEIPVIAITGSNGKTTTKELIGAVLSSGYTTLITEGNLNNHIGVPLTLLNLNKSHEIAIIEMGANHQGEIAALSEITVPNFGLITNFGKAHLEGFGGFEGVIKGKSELYNNLIASEGVIFYNKQDPKQTELLASYDNALSYGLQEEAEVFIDLLQSTPTIKARWNGTEFTSSLFGTYNATNIAAAIAVGVFFELETTQIITAIEAYTGKQMRSEIRITNNQKIFLDAYNANPTSMAESLTVFKALKWPNTTVIVGDMFELGADAPLEHERLVEHIESLGFEQVILVGKLFCKTSNSFHCFETTEELIENKELIVGKNLFLKGSRSMALERILEHL